CFSVGLDGGKTWKMLWLIKLSNNYDNWSARSATPEDQNGLHFTLRSIAAATQICAPNSKPIGHYNSAVLALCAASQIESLTSAVLRTALIIGFTLNGLHGQTFEQSQL